MQENAKITPEAIAARVAAIPYWYHKIQLPGITTPGWAPLCADAYQIPADLAGKRVLDIGAWDGYWSFEALKRGAREVVAIDDFSDQPGVKKWESFDLCAEALQIPAEKISRLEMSVYDISQEKLGRFDVIFFFGVLYHCRHPLLALEKLAAVCDGSIHVETAISDDFAAYRGGLNHGYGDSLVAEFYPGRQYGDNPTNWWVPTKAALGGMLTAAGFRDVITWKLNDPKDVMECRGFACGAAPNQKPQFVAPPDSLGFRVDDPVEVPDPDVLKLNLGAGTKPLGGYRNLDAKSGHTIFPLADYADNSVDEIRASHVLEHFPRSQTVAVVREWFRVLKPGGVMKIAVPNFDFIVDAYRAGGGHQLPLEGYLMGGQVDRFDVHHAMFNTQKLNDLMEAVGLRGMRTWKSEIDDCASLAVSLNIQGVKPDPSQAAIQKIAAVMTVPRYGPTAPQYVSALAFGPLGIKIHRTGGAFWDKAFENAFELAMKEKPDAIITLDYDSIFTQDDVRELIRLLNEHPDADAICTVQTNRHTQKALFTHRGPDGKNARQIELNMADELLPIATGHFGLTIIRVSALQKLKHPWFHARPDDEGTWSNKCVDADIAFWQQFEALGLKAFIALHVVIGHVDDIILWPGPQMECVYQKAVDYFLTGKPEGTFK